MLETCRGPWFSISEWKVHHVGFIILTWEKVGEVWHHLLPSSYRLLWCSPLLAQTTKMCSTHQHSAQLSVSATKCLRNCIQTRNLERSFLPSERPVRSVCTLHYLVVGCRFRLCTCCRASGTHFLVLYATTCWLRNVSPDAFYAFFQDSRSFVLLLLQVKLVPFMDWACCRIQALVCSPTVRNCWIPHWCLIPRLATWLIIGSPLPSLTHSFRLFPILFFWWYLILLQLYVRQHFCKPLYVTTFISPNWHFLLKAP
jgi:hypothetical protein